MRVHTGEKPNKCTVSLVSAIEKQYVCNEL